MVHQDGKRIAFGRFEAVPIAFAGASGGRTAGTRPYSLHGEAPRGTVRIDTAPGRRCPGGGPAAPRPGPPRQVGEPSRGEDLFAGAANATRIVFECLPEHPMVTVCQIIVVGEGSAAVGRDDPVGERLDQTWNGWIVARKYGADRIAGIERRRDVQRGSTVERQRPGRHESEQIYLGRRVVEMHFFEVGSVSGTVRYRVQQTGGRGVGIRGPDRTHSLTDRCNATAASGNAVSGIAPDPPAKQASQPITRLAAQPYEAHEHREGVRIGKQPYVRDGGLSAEEPHDRAKRDIDLAKDPHPVLVRLELVVEVFAEDVAALVGENTSECKPLIDRSEAKLSRYLAEVSEIHVLAPLQPGVQRMEDFGLGQRLARAVEAVEDLPQTRLRRRLGRRRSKSGTRVPTSPQRRR